MKGNIFAFSFFGVDQVLLRITQTVMYCASRNGIHLISIIEVSLFMR